MSVNYLRFIPADPELVPDERTQHAALAELRRLAPRSESIHMWSSDKKTFVDQGANFHSLKCPFCKTELDTEWWQMAMDRAYDGEGFGLLAVETPCCHQATSLNDLDYDFPAGFARFGLDTRSPDFDDEQAMQVLSALESVMNCPLRRIWAHY